MTDLTFSQRSLCRLAISDGYSCGISGGYQEQNPYSIWTEEILFDSWRNGWFDGIDNMPRGISDRPVPSNLPSILSNEWKSYIRRTKPRAVIS